MQKQKPLNKDTVPNGLWHAFKIHLPLDGAKARRPNAIAGFSLASVDLAGFGHDSVLRTRDSLGVVHWTTGVAAIDWLRGVGFSGAAGRTGSIVSNRILRGVANGSCGVLRPTIAGDRLYRRREFPRNAGRDPMFGVRICSELADLVWPKRPSAGIARIPVGKIS